MSRTITLVDDDPFEIPDERVVAGVSLDWMARLVQDYLNRWGYIDIPNTLGWDDGMAGTISQSAYELADALLEVLAERGHGAISVSANTT